MTTAFDSKELAHTMTCSKSEEKRHEGNGTNKARICMRPNLTNTLNPNIKVLLLSDLRTLRGD